MLIAHRWIRTESFNIHVPTAWQTKSLKTTLTFLISFIFIRPFNLIRHSFWSFHPHSQNQLFIQRMNLSTWRRLCPKAVSPYNLMYTNLRNWQWRIAASRKEMFDLFVSNKFMNFFFFSLSRFPYTSMLAIYIFWVAQDYAFRILFICLAIVEWNTNWNREETDI